MDILMKLLVMIMVWYSQQNMKTKENERVRTTRWHIHLGGGSFFARRDLRSPHLALCASQVNRLKPRLPSRSRTSSHCTKLSHAIACSPSTIPTAKRAPRKTTREPPCRLMLVWHFDFELTKGGSRADLYSRVQPPLSVLLTIWYLYNLQV
ncbi:hypothetical protein CC80DRAFT_491516 [Byssothecium circinans]|uniref:Uncharacterized protein n=1 Tax=Byssothecium circinans TaxID=147558 RepID=A0A6A5TZB3_9PLEO|nr:hypothetical protein CC80DRAFT_491516 [Byssothecium circinans]